MNKSETIGAIAAALAKAQSEMKNPAFDMQNPHFKNRYASLAAVRDAVVPIMSKHGIAVVQSLRSVDAGVECETTLIHASGEWLADTLVLPVSKADAQGYGSAATYARRYSLMAFAGVVGDADDDGNAAAAAPQKLNTTTPLAAIEKAGTLEDLKTAYTSAIRECSKMQDLDAHKLLTTAKDKRKAELTVKEEAK